MIYLGVEAGSGAPVEVPLEAFTRTHTRVQGTTGAGKSHFLQLLCEEFIESRHTVVLIDGKGDLFDTMSRYCAGRGMTGERVVILDPKAASEKNGRTAGFNPIALGNLQPWDRAQFVLDAYKKLFREDGETKPWLEDYLLHALVPLEYAGLGVLELEHFLSDPRFREAVLSRCPDSDVQRMWEVHSELGRGEQAIRVAAALTRGRLIKTSGEGLRRILGQVDETLDWTALIERRGILLVNANPGSVRGKGAWFLGTLVLQKIIETAMERPKGSREPVFVVVDECQEFASPDFIEGLTKLRGYGVHLVLAHQTLAQLRQVPGFYDAVASCCQNRFIFSTHAEDAALLAEELFTGFWPPREVLQEIETTYFAPVEETFTRSSTTHVPGGRTWRYDEESGEVGYTESESYDVTTESEETRTRHEERQQVTSRQIETMDDVKERAKAFVAVQHQQQAIMKIGQTRPIGLRVADVPEPGAQDQSLRSWKTLVLENYPAAPELDLAMTERISAVCEKPAVIDKPEDYRE